MGLSEGARLSVGKRVESVVELLDVSFISPFDIKDGRKLIYDHTSATKRILMTRVLWYLWLRLDGSRHVFLKKEEVMSFNDWKENPLQMEASKVVIFAVTESGVDVFFCIQLGAWEKCGTIFYRLRFDREKEVHESKIYSNLNCFMQYI